MYYRTGQSDNYLNQKENPQCCFFLNIRTNLLPLYPLMCITIVMSMSIWSNMSEIFKHARARHIFTLHVVQNGITHSYFNGTLTAFALR